MINKELLDILVCPETKESLSLADQALIEKINARIRAGEIVNRGGERVTDPIDEGLIRSDGRYLYPIRDDIPIMLIDQAIPLEGILESL